MLTGFLRTIVLFSVTAVVLRLMGKRQLAQLQPYEVVITLMISDLATLPMADVEIPLLSGVVSILTLLLVHSLLSALSYASVRMRRIICGRPSVPRLVSTTTPSRPSMNGCGANWARLRT